MRVSVGKMSASIFMVTLSGIVSAGVAVKSKHLQRSRLLILWLYFCLIFATYFSGSLTSVVISPPKEYRMTKTSDLFQRNYSLVLMSEAYALQLRDPLRMRGLFDRMNFLKTLVDSAAVMESQRKLFKKLVNPSKKVALFSTWGSAIEGLSRAEEYIRDHRLRNLHCYLGQELVLNQNVFIIVATPRRMDSVGGIVQVMMEAGFFNVWYKEYVGISTSPKVQQRSKFISQTKLVAKKDPPRALRVMGGKLKNIFVLWLTCLGISLFIFSAEKLWNIMIDFLFKKVEQLFTI